MRSVICCILLVSLVGCGNNVVKVDTSNTTPPKTNEADPVVEDGDPEEVRREPLPRWVLTDKQGDEVRLAVSPSEYYAFDPTFDDPVQPLRYTDGCFTASALDIGTLRFVNTFSLETGRPEECLADDGPRVLGFHLDTDCTSPVYLQEIDNFTPSPAYTHKSNGQIFSVQSGTFSESNLFYQLIKDGEQLTCQEWPFNDEDRQVMYRPLEPVPEELLSVFEDGAPYTLEWR